MDPNILKEALELPDEEKLELIGDLWDSLENPDDIQLTKEQKEELDRRLEEYYKDPTSGSSWEEVKSRILGS